MYRSYAAGSQCKQTSTILVPLAGDGAGHMLPPPPGGRAWTTWGAAAAWLVCGGAGWLWRGTMYIIYMWVRVWFHGMRAHRRGGWKEARGGRSCLCGRVRDFIKQQRKNLYQKLHCLIPYFHTRSVRPVIPAAGPRIWPYWSRSLIICAKSEFLIIKDVNPLFSSATAGNTEIYPHSNSNKAAQFIFFSKLVWIIKLMITSCLLLMITSTSELPH